MLKSNYFFTVLILGIQFLTTNGYSQVVPDDVKISRIYSDMNYNAFTSLIEFKGDLYCAFRSGESHVYGKDGVIKILRSKKGKKWTELASLSVDGFDLRDPKLSVNPEGQIVVLIGGSIYQGKKFLGCQTHVSFSNKKGTQFTDPQPINLDDRIKTKNNWLWRLTWNGAIGYGAIYHVNEKLGAVDTGTISLVTTTDGINYELASKLNIEGRPNEVTIRFISDGEMLMLIRREKGNRKALLGKSKAPYKDWIYIEAPFFIGGPDFIALGENRFVGGGRIDGKTGIISFDADGNFKKVLDLPSNSDSSYPGFVLRKNQLFISYYSSHETEKTSIYLAQLPLHYFK